MAYTANSTSSELIAGPTLSTLSSAEGNGAAFVTPQKSENGVNVQRKLPNITNSGPLLDRWGRVATDLRISLTDKCNLPEGESALRRGDCAPCRYCDY